MWLWSTYYSYEQNHYSIMWYSYNNGKQSRSVFILHHSSSFFLSLHAAKLRIQIQTYRYQFNSMSHWKDHQSNSVQSNSIIIIHEPLEVRLPIEVKMLLTRSRNWQLDQYSSPPVRTREPGGELGIRSVGSSTTVPSDADLTKTNSIPELYELETNSAPCTNPIPIQHCATIIWYRFKNNTTKQTNNKYQSPTNQSTTSDLKSIK